MKCLKSAYASRNGRECIAVQCKQVDDAMKYRQANFAHCIFPA
jgi:hypothetical protein